MKLELKKIDFPEIEFFQKKDGGVIPAARTWETHTPYSERCDIHFYVNKCGFKIVDFFNAPHREEHDLTEEFKDINSSGFFRFEKIVKP